MAVNTVEEFDVLEERKETFPVRVNDEYMPIDMLLEHIQKAQIPIRDVFVSDVTNQFLAHIRSMEFLDVDKASYFATYATRILDIKIRSLLPQTEEEQQALEEEKESFIAELQLRQVFNIATSALHQRETINVFGIEPVFDKSDYNVVIADDQFNMDALLDAFARIMHRIDAAAAAPVAKKKTKVILKDRFTVVDKTKELILVLKDRRSVRFDDLFLAGEDEPEYTMGERVSTFLAVLELLRRQFAKVEQKEEFGEIVINIAEGADKITYEDIVGNEPYLYDEDNKSAAGTKKKQE